MPEPKLRTRKKPNRWWSDLSAIAIAVLVVFSARPSLADHYYVPTGSMIPSVEIGDRVWVSKASYSLRIPFTQLGLKTGAPDRGDVVVFESPDNSVRPTVRRPIPFASTPEADLRSAPSWCPRAITSCSGTIGGTAETGACSASWRRRR
jgi:signal peptidase I